MNAPESCHRTRLFPENVLESESPIASIRSHLENTTKKHEKPAAFLDGAVDGSDGSANLEDQVAAAVGGSDGQTNWDVDWSVGLDQDAGSDRGNGGSNGARDESAKVGGIRVDSAAEVLAVDGENGGRTRGVGNGSSEGTSDCGADVLADAERDGAQSDAGAGQVSWGSTRAVGELGLGNGGKSESSDGSEELHLEDRVWVS